VIEPLELDPLETEAIYQELDRRGIELLVEPEREPEPEPQPEKAPPVPAQPLETTTDALQLFLREERTLWMELGREPTLDEIANEASLPIEQAREVRAAARASASLDQPVGDQEDAVFGDFVAGDDPLPEERVEGALRSQALAVALQALGERERQVLVLRYGLIDEEPKTLEEIGKRLGLTRERVRQIELDSLRRLANLREMQMVQAP
jgi:RNA polymerase primary sigma factor